MKSGGVAVARTNDSGDIHNATPDGKWLVAGFSAWPWGGYASGLRDVPD